MPLNPTDRQRRFLFSSGSPLSQAQKDRLANELRHKKGRKKSKRKHRRA